MTCASRGIDGSIGLMGSVRVVTFVGVFFCLERNQTDAVVPGGALGDVDLEAVSSSQERSRSVIWFPRTSQ